jgi:hypothetical protein
LLDLLKSLPSSSTRATARGSFLFQEFALDGRPALSENRLKK